MASSGGIVLCVIVYVHGVAVFAVSCISAFYWFVSGIVRFFSGRPGFNVSVA